MIGLLLRYTGNLEAKDSRGRTAVYYASALFFGKEEEEVPRLLGEAMDRAPGLMQREFEAGIAHTHNFRTISWDFISNIFCNQLWNSARLARPT